MLLLWFFLSVVSIMNHPSLGINELPGNHGWMSDQRWPTTYWCSCYQRCFIRTHPIWSFFKTTSQQSTNQRSRTPSGNQTWQTWLAGKSQTSRFFMIFLYIPIKISKEKLSFLGDAAFFPEVFCLKWNPNGWQSRAFRCGENHGESPGTWSTWPGNIGSAKQKTMERSWNIQPLSVWLLVDG